ncbi:MerR family transcriptional regulator [Acidithiobacillus thiooxidans]|jgi:DNA-binding transcriptional MerR regulator|uniref:MerR family transcriptional regulator n=2 Tax=Acidithiobacillus thiooxidans TaxID=930 RepID=A0A1C2I7V1_ACITH|nr:MULTISPECIES: MerR family transcriptional regulator [Acidithiobacillus]MDD5472499.1 MerR family transcriptional regulator [Sideroxydans sp.]MBE7566532.1 MerR family transcriptional regulator [Acidithiobacillus sp. HP-11]MBU2740501.1 MerR family transcriptional regulator [Acidithiobacillus albertensis]MBU2752760.1 MerR family transcriptional regulator [Acidithiobacillus thiooxidans]MBU2793742.1 MerR family transcriptional regulator [Acidithiobacillus thiooxidans]
MVANQITAKGKAGKELVALPEIPEKRYFSISEASLLCGVKAHVLRYWEQEFPLLSPLKRKGNRRYYQRHDLLLARQIRELLYGEGYTIHGARERLQGLRNESSHGHPVSAAQLEFEMEDNASGLNRGTGNRLTYLRTELSELIKICAGKH